VGGGEGRALGAVARLGQVRDEWGPGAHEDGFRLLPSDEIDSPAGFAAWVARPADESDPAKPVAASQGALYVPMDRSRSFDELGSCRWWISGNLQPPMMMATTVARPRLATST
jgi:hypothetical protein